MLTSDINNVMWVLGAAFPSFPPTSSLGLTLLANAIYYTYIDSVVLLS